MFNCIIIVPHLIIFKDNKMVTLFNGCDRVAANWPTVCALVHGTSTSVHEICAQIGRLLYMQQ